MSHLDSSAMIQRLERQPEAIVMLVRQFTRAGVQWRPTEASGEPAGWSVAQIVAHLADEEVEDFRPRLLSTLRDPAEPWLPIDPENAATERNYQDIPVEKSLDRYVRERQESVRLLKGLRQPDWALVHMAQWGPIMAGDLLASWVAHDILHMRQIVKRLYQIAQTDSGGYSSNYAGEWKG